MKDILQDALNEIDDKYIAEAAAPQKRSRKPYWFAAVAAVLILAIGFHSLFSPAQALIAAPIYPIAVPYAEQKENLTQYKLWKEFDETYHRQPDGFADNLQPFFTRSTQVFLSDADTANKVYSPVNLYMALAMLGECTDGSTRQQILDLLNTPNIEDVRTQANTVWKSLYYDDGLATSILANSVWIDNEFSYNPFTVNTLASKYMASVYRGNLGTNQMNKQLEDWLNKQTGDLLTEYTDGIGLSPETVFALVSTILFQGKWETPFEASKTKNGVFHAATGDTEAAFMHNAFTDMYWQGNNYGIIRLPLKYEYDGFTMWFILPNEGFSTQALVQDGTCFDIVQDPFKEKNYQSAIIELSLPKFDISSKTDLIDGLKQLGITDAFDTSTADYSPLTSKNIYLHKADQAARVTIDEKGVSAASYTKLEFLCGGSPTLEVDFILDRPFLFVITSRDGLPLFTGIVNEP